MEKDDLTYKIIGCAIKVHNTMGPGFQEVIYQRCLAIELERAGLSYKSEQEQTVYYQGIEVGTLLSIVLQNKIQEMLPLSRYFQVATHDTDIKQKPDLLSSAP